MLRSCLVLLIAVLIAPPVAATCDVDTNGDPICSGTMYGSPNSDWLVRADTSRLPT